MPKKKNTASSLNKEKFLIIGAGNMGIAVIKSLFNHRISSKKIVVIEKNQSSELKKLKRSNNLFLLNSLMSSASEIFLVILIIRIQFFQEIPLVPMVFPRVNESVSEVLLDAHPYRHLR